MHSSDVTPLTQLLSEPCEVEISPQMWAASAFIGGLRTASNAGRQPSHDRGPAGNAVVDIQGVVGELILFDHLSRHLSGWSVNPLLLDWDGGSSFEASSRADLEISLEGEDVDVRGVGEARSHHATVSRPDLREPIEAKCHLDLTDDDLAESDLKHKWDFAVNQEAVRGSYGIGARLMVPVLAAPGQATGIIGQSILLADVLRWSPVDYGYGHVALAVPLMEISPLAWGADWQNIRERLHAAPTYVPLKIMTLVHQGALGMFDRLRNDPSFELDGLAPDEVIGLCASIAREYLSAHGMTKRKAQTVDR